MPEVAPGVFAITLRPDDEDSPHVYWIRGADGGVLIDAGHGEEDISQGLIDEIKGLRGSGPPPKNLLLTDRFGEHTEGAPALQRAFPGITISAGAADVQTITESLGDVRVGPLRGGEEFGIAGDPARTIRAVATPGHTPGSMCYLLEPDLVLFSGDCVLSEGTTAVHLSEGGGMAEYVDSLKRLLALDARLLLSFHGAPVLDPTSRLRDLIAHRDARDASILDCLRDGLTGLDAIRDRLYGPANLPEWRWNAAREQIHAHLIKLVSEGRAVEVESGERYRLP